MASPLISALEFLQDFGFFDVVLPFLLVFTITFAILEKTKIFGTEKYKGEMVPKKSVNSMVAFAVALFVVVTKEIVVSIQTAMPQIALALIVLVALMMLVGTLKGEAGFDFGQHTNWLYFLIFVIFIGVLAIFLNSIDWLEPILDYIEDYWQDTFIVLLIFLAIIIGTVYFVIGKEPRASGEPKRGSNERTTQ